MADVYADTSVIAIGNSFVEVLWAAQNFALIIFDDDLSNKSIPIGASASAIDSPYGTLVAHLNKIPLIYGGANYLLLTPHPREFDVSIHGVSKCHGGK